MPIECPSTTSTKRGVAPRHEGRTQHGGAVLRWGARLPRHDPRLDLPLGAPDRDDQPVAALTRGLVAARSGHTPHMPNPKRLAWQGVAAAPGTLAAIAVRQAAVTTWRTDKPDEPPGKP